jgi:hypothetical protein
MRLIRWISLIAVTASFVIALPAAAAAQQDSGQICVRAFTDINNDGTYTPPDEALLADVTFILSNETGRIGSYRTDGTEEEPYCFADLALGQYTVQARPDAKKITGEATTPGQWVVPLAGGAQYDIVYGVQADGTAADGQTEASTSTSSSGMTPIGRIALGLLGVAVLGVAGFLAYSILQRARSA